MSGDPSSISLGGDSTLNLKNFLKNLSSLAGGDDSIFVIIDDRFDVWSEEVKDKLGITKKKISENLLLLPAYYHHVSESENNTKMESYKQLILKVNRDYDLDVTLVFH